jgi:small-conductance mechanosensitive channel
MQHNVRIAIYDALEQAGIEIPFDQIVVNQA